MQRFVEKQDDLLSDWRVSYSRLRPTYLGWHFQQVHVAATSFNLMSGQSALRFIVQSRERRRSFERFD